eukprot:COSAG01_NODE_20032_length_975_cov_0.686073_1_plen_95_part_10
MRTQWRGGRPSSGTLVSADYGATLSAPPAFAPPPFHAHQRRSPAGTAGRYSMATFIYRGGRTSAGGGGAAGSQAASQASSQHRSQAAMVLSEAQP